MDRAVPFPSSMLPFAVGGLPQWVKAAEAKRSITSIATFRDPIIETIVSLALSSWQNFSSFPSSRHAASSSAAVVAPRMVV